MSLINFKNKPNTSTAVNADNLNNNFSEVNLFKNIFNPYAISNSPYASYDITTHKTTLAANGTGTSFYTYDKITFKKGKTYTLTIILDALSETANGNLLFRFDVDNSTVISNYFDVTTGDLIKTFTFTPNNDITPNRIGVYCVNAGISFLVQIEENSVSTPYKDFAGYIVEAASDNNGSWIKYSDGTMICFQRKTFETGSVNININAGGGLYRTNSFAFDNFPQEFIEQPIVVKSGYLSYVSEQEAWFLDSSNVTSTTPGQGKFVCGVVSNQRSGYMQYIAIGRWK